MNNAIKIPIRNQEYKSWDELPVLISVEEAAKLFKISVECVQRECKAGNFPASKFGREWRIDKKKIMELFGY